MKKPRFTGSEIFRVLEETEVGIPIRSCVVSTLLAPPAFTNDALNSAAWNYSDRQAGFWYTGCYVQGLSYA